MSLTMAAPASSAAAMVAAWRVSTETRGPAAARPRITGRMRRCSSSVGSAASRARALAAYVDDVGARGSHREAGGDRRIGVQEVCRRR